MFELVLAMWCLLASWRWGDWKNIEKYYPTLLYVTVANLIYKVIALFHFHLWEVKGVGMLGDTVAYFVDILFIMVPATLIYLSNYPDTALKQIFYIAKWVTLFTVIEWIGLEYFNTINHHNGWNMWWSLLFNIVMFLMIRLHYVNFRLALLLSIPCALFYLLWFDYI